VSLWRRLKSKLLGSPPPPSAPLESDDVAKKKKSPTRAPKSEPADAAGWIDRATQLLRDGKHAEAVEGFTKAIQLDAHCAKAYAGRGVALEALGRADEAKADYTTSIGIELRGTLKTEYGYTPPQT
jgi:Flp pilus assembly protein TadD